MEKLNYDPESADTTCPCCGKKRYYIKFFQDLVILRCEDCEYQTEI